MSETDVADAEARDLEYHGKNHGETGRDKVPNIWGVVPIGGIIMWSGAIADIPKHWALCNGSNGTPDLRDRFIVGAGSTYAVGATGGATTLSAHTHDFTQPTAHGITQPVFAAPTAHTITQPVVAAHSDLSHDNNHTETQPTAHDSHNVIEFVATGLAPSLVTGLYVIQGAVGGGDTTIAHTNNHTGSDVAAHSNHSISAHTLSTNVALSNNHDAPSRTTDVALSNNHSGGAVGAVVGTVTQLPPYYALAYIQRVS